METDITTQLTAAAVIVYIIEALKKAGWCKWIHADSKTINRVISAVAAAAITVGINWSGDAATGWTIQIPPLAAVGAGAWAWMKQFIFQQVVFDTVVKPNPPSGGV